MRERLATYTGPNRGAKTPTGNGKERRRAGEDRRAAEKSVGRAGAQIQRVERNRERERAQTGEGYEKNPKQGRMGLQHTVYTHIDVAYGATRIIIITGLVHSHQVRIDPNEITRAE